MTKLIVGPDMINRAVSDLAQRVSDSLSTQVPTTFLIVANGALHFGSDLLNQVHTWHHCKKDPIPFSHDIIKTKSYDIEVNKQGELEILIGATSELIRGHDVIIIDDIWGTGLTLSALSEHVRSLEAETVRTCVFCTKNKDADVDWYGILLDSDKFLYGYGLDFHGTLRSSRSVYETEIVV